jgi:hypothetical protein
VEFSAAEVIFGFKVWEYRDLSVLEAGRDLGDDDVAALKQRLSLATFGKESGGSPAQGEGAADVEYGLSLAQAGLGRAPGYAVAAAQ